MREVFTRSIYLSGEGVNNLISQCESIIKREKLSHEKKKWSFNDLVLDALNEYVIRHGVGNNSYTLDTFGIKWTKAIPVSHCGFKNCEKLAIGTALYVPRKQTMGLCASHLNHVRDSAKANPDLWQDIKFPLEKKGSLA